MAKLNKIFGLTEGTLDLGHLMMPTQSNSLNSKERIDHVAISVIMRVETMTTALVIAKELGLIDC